MNKSLRLLLVEDSADDAELIVRTLEVGGYTVTYERVETSEGMRAALTESRWDLVLSDYRMPRFSAPAALDVLQSAGLDLPFIIISGTIGEETAVSALKAGTSDRTLRSNGSPSRERNGRPSIFGTPPPRACWANS